MGVIGDTLFEARTRRAVDLDEVHAVTGIRSRYLRAIEEEDWDALPEEFYARSFIRKYAQFLGVDPEPLVEEYRRQRGTSGLGESPTSPFARTSSRRAEALRRRRQRQGIYAWLGAAAVAAVIVAAIVLLVSSGGEGGGGGEGGSKAAKSVAGNGGKGAGTGKKGGGGKGGAHQGGAKAGAHGGAQATSVMLKIEPTAEVWACVLDAKGKPLVDGATLATGETMGPFHSRSYTAAFGNGGVAVSVDGKLVKTPATPSPMGFTVDSKGKVHELPEGERPSCE
ncbi:MAG TPA: helix-turn-helix transcriptional regulator [Solirubrobacterales bacterium]|nr:helix-turn-helix transcriptional regulator [Solirubrobacterales bacterium]